MKQEDEQWWSSRMTSPMHRAGSTHGSWADFLALPLQWASAVIWKPVLKIKGVEILEIPKLSSSVANKPSESDVTCLESWYLALIFSLQDVTQWLGEVEQLSRGIMEPLVTLK